MVVKSKYDNFSQSQDTGWEAAQEARLAEYQRKRAAGEFDKTTKTEEQRQQSLAETKKVGDPLMTGKPNALKIINAEREMAKAPEVQQPDTPTQPVQTTQQTYADGQTEMPFTGQAPAAGAPTQHELSGLAGTVQRDLNRESAALAKLGVDANTMMNMNPKKLFEMTYTKEELAGLQDYQDLLAYENAKSTMEGTPKPTNTMLAGLEDALRMKQDPAKQNLGVSEMYAKAGIPTEGVGGYATLSQSINNQSNLMNDRYKSFVNQMQGTAGAMADTYNAVREKYELHKDEYDRVAQVYDNVVQNVMKTEQAMKMLEAQNNLDKEAREWAQQNPTYAEQTSRGRLEFDKAQYYDSLQSEINESMGDLPKGSGFYRTENAFGKGTVTGIDGSKYWKHGLDFVLDGGAGAEVKVPVGGKVIQVDTGHTKGEKNSFGNRVKIELPDGRQMWISHLQDTNVNVGDQINPGTVIGTQGNTGSTYGKTGIHLDITMTKPDGSYHTPREVAGYLDALGKVEAGKGVWQDVAGMATDPMKALTELPGSVQGLANQFGTPEAELPLDQQWVQEFGDEPTAAEKKSLETYGAEYINRVKEAQGKGDVEKQKQESMEIDFIIKNQNFVNQLKDKTSGMSESAIKNAIKNSQSLQDTFGGKFSDYQVDLIYNALK